MKKVFQVLQDRNNRDPLQNWIYSWTVLLLLWPLEELAISRILKISTWQLNVYHSLWHLSHLLYSFITLPTTDKHWAKLYADDIVIWAEKEQDRQSMTDVNDWCKTWRLSNKWSEFTSEAPQLAPVNISFILLTKGLILLKS